MKVFVDLPGPLFSLVRLGGLWAVAGGPQKHSFFNVGTATVSAFAEPALLRVSGTTPGKPSHIKEAVFLWATRHSAQEGSKREVLRIKKLINYALVDFADRVKI